MMTPFYLLFPVSSDINPQVSVSAAKQCAVVGSWLAATFFTQQYAQSINNNRLICCPPFSVWSERFSVVS